MEKKPGLYGIEQLLKNSASDPIYRKTLSGLRPDRTKIELVGDSLRFKDYPFEPSTVFPNGQIDCGQISEIRFDYPSEIRLVNGDILFVSYENKAALVAFINRTTVKVQRRLPTWTALLDPFLDTWEDQDTIDRQFAWFEKIGLNRETVTDIRREVGHAMIAYNFGTTLWEWGALNLYDVLRAQHAHLSKSEFANFYSRAMQLTQRDTVMEARWRPVGETTFHMDLFSVLLEWYPRKTSAVRKFFKRKDTRDDDMKRFEEKLTAELTAAYSEPQRCYHTLLHIEQCLYELGCAWSYAIYRNEVQWALLFHDAIYDPKRQDNELRSAEWACKVMAELERPEDEQARVRNLILATAHSDEPRTTDEALLLDIDLSILGAEAASFDAYDRSIRIEYEWVPDVRYRDARTKVLRSFLDRSQIFRTAPFRERYEARARENLQRALERLSTRVS